MQCRVCGSQLPPGANACPVCGTPVEQPAENNPSQLPPTVYSPQPGQPPTNYGSGNFDQPPPPNQYNQAGNQYPPSYNPQYAQPSNPPNPPDYNQPNYNQPNYNQPNYNQPNQQGYGQPSGANNFNNNQYGQYNQYGQKTQYDQYGNGIPTYPPAPGQGYNPPQRPRNRSPWPWIIVGIVVLVILACVGGTYLIARAGSSSQTTNKSTPTAAQSTPTTAATSTAQATPTTGANTNGSTPSGDPIDATAAQIITSPQTATAVDTGTAAAKPGATTSTFKTKQDIFVVFKLNLGNVDLKAQTLYVSARFYADGAKVFSANPLKLIPTTGGYFGAQYYVATQQGAAELVLCKQSNCSDAKVGQVVQFTVTD